MQQKLVKSQTAKARTAVGQERRRGRRSWAPRYFSVLYGCAGVIRRQRTTERGVRRGSKKPRCTLSVEISRGAQLVHVSLKLPCPDPGCFTANTVLRDLPSAMGLSRGPRPTCTASLTPQRVGFTPGAAGGQETVVRIQDSASFVKVPYFLRAFFKKKSSSLFQKMGAKKKKRDTGFI